MDARKIIEKIKAGEPVTGGEARWFGHALSGQSISDAQAGAFAMAVCLKGLGPEGRTALTEGMRDSGDVLEWDMPGPVIDKHSTGGVGDCVSLLLAPALACLGAYVPMISGRGLGHTGGTLDKLEAIPNYVTEIGSQRLKHILKETGCAIVGATGRIATSDKRLYAIRDVTSTVASIDLITASILSKKLAAGLDALVLDVKTGSGAFMESFKDAISLANSLVEVANAAGCKTSALVTDMSQPLADAAGNAVEIRAVMESLTGTRVNPRLIEVTKALGGQLLATAGMASTPEAGSEEIGKVLEDGRATERFGKMVSALGGPEDFVESWPNKLPEAVIFREIPAGKFGKLAGWNTRALGEAVVGLGGGRLKETDRIDPSVGLSAILPIGSDVDEKTPVAMVHAADEARADAAIKRVQNAVTILSRKPSETPLILKAIS